MNRRDRRKGAIETKNVTRDQLLARYALCMEELRQVRELRSEDEIKRELRNIDFLLGERRQSDG